jgi:hypothetical protein
MLTMAHQEGGERHEAEAVIMCFGHLFPLPAEPLDLPWARRRVALLSAKDAHD